MSVGFAGDYRLYVMEFVESGHRRKIVDVGMQYFVTYLREYRVVKLKE